MRIVLTENCTLDGVIDMASGWFDPDSEPDDGMRDELRRQMANEDGLLLGRHTFEEFRGYWPKRTDDESGISAHLDRVTKYVVSSTLGDPGWANTTVLRRSAVEEVRELRAAPGRDLGVTGSISVAHQLVAADVVDEYRLFVYPVVVGEGATLFPAGTPRLDLHLLETKRFASGVAYLRYERLRP